MHELSLAHSVVEAITDRLGEQPVVRVRLEIGKLSGVVVDSIRFCFEVVTQGTTLQGATLQIEEPDGQARCRHCGNEFAVTDLLAACDCGSLDIAIQAGDQLRIQEVEVARDVRNLRV